jgi:hypothetical protein
VEDIIKEAIQAQVLAGMAEVEAGEEAVVRPDLLE